MADFSEIPKGVLRKIAVEHLQSLEDIESFNKVCTLWRSETSDINHTNFYPSLNIQLPWLMLVDSPTSSYRRFFSLRKGMYHKIDLPHFDIDADDYRRYFSSKGWLIAVSRNKALITFYDVFCGTVINPPSVPLLEFIRGDEWDEYSYHYQFSKFIFSTDNRHHNRSDDMQVAMIFNPNQEIMFWRPGQRHWIRPITFCPLIDDACFFRGLFYSIDNRTQVIAFESPPQIIINLRSQGFIPNAPIKNYIVPFGPALLVVSRYLEYYDEPDDKFYWTESFELFEVNVDNRTARQVQDIGNRALFIGHTSTFFVEASPLHKHTCRPNSIYFTDDNSESYCLLNSSRGGGADMGIYSLEENKVVGRVYEGPSQFSYETPPLWVELPHY